MTWIKPVLVGLRRNRRRRPGAANGLIVTTSSMPNNFPHNFRPGRSVRLIPPLSQETAFPRGSRRLWKHNWTDSRQTVRMELAGLGVSRSLLGLGVKSASRGTSQPNSSDRDDIAASLRSWVSGSVIASGSSRKVTMDHVKNLQGDSGLLLTKCEVSTYLIAWMD